jgi:selenocysteine lyase/cysteine desulfurase
MRIIGANATAWVSMYLYSNEADVDALVDALDEVSSIFQVGSDTTDGMTATGIRR